MTKNNKVALVTGGASGIGLAITEKFVSQGIKTYVVGRNREKTEEICDSIGSLAIPVVYDLQDLSNMGSIVTQIMDAEGKIDILVNNAGINLKRPFTEVTNDDFNSIIHTNVFSVFALSREVVSAMRGVGPLSIINISSMASQYGIPYVIAYTASKSAIEGMTKAMAVELAVDNVRVNCVAPGFIETKMSAKALDSDPERKAKVLGRTPMKKLGKTADVANAVAYLASDESSYVTGVVICVDGGNSIGF